MQAFTEPSVRDFPLFSILHVFTHWKTKQPYNEHSLGSRHCNSLWGHSKSYFSSLKISVFLWWRLNTVIMLCQEHVNQGCVSIVEGISVMTVPRRCGNSWEIWEEWDASLALSTSNPQCPPPLTCTNSWSPGIMFCLYPRYSQYKPFWSQGLAHPNKYLENIWRYKPGVSYLSLMDLYHQKIT